MDTNEAKFTFEEFAMRVGYYLKDEALYREPFVSSLDRASALWNVVIPLAKDGHMLPKIIYRHGLYENLPADLALLCVGAMAVLDLMEDNG